MILGWGIVILLLIMSIFLMSGRGSWLIAGYNTMSKEEKKEFDEKKLCHSVGITLLITTVPTAILLFITQYADKNNLDNIILYVALIYTFLIILLCVIFCLRFNKYKK